MATSLQSVFSNIEKEFQRTLMMTECWRSTYYTAWWAKEPGPFFPGYVICGRFAHILGALFPSLWLKWVWRRIIKRVFDKFRKELVPIYKETSPYWYEHREPLFSFLEKLMIEADERCRFLTLACLHHFVMKSLVMTDIALGGHKDDFSQLKQKQNELALSLYAEIQDEFSDDFNSFEKLVYLSIRANWFDVVDGQYSAFQQGFSQEVSDILDDQDYFFKTRQDIGLYDINQLYTSINGKPKIILYECDNAGEIIIDLLLIRFLLKKGHCVQLAVREIPFLNDVILDDVKKLMADPRLSEFQAYIASNQFSFVSYLSYSAGKLLFDAGKTYKKAFMGSDLILLKGQGHFSTFPFTNDYGRDVFSLFGLRSSLIKLSLAQLCGSAVLKFNNQPILIASSNKNRTGQ